MPNFLTLLRILIAPAFVILMVKANTISSYKYLAFGLFAFGAATDWADGFVARHTETVSTFGATFDQLADRLLIGAALITLYVLGILPLAFFAIVLGRDVVLALGYPIFGKLDRSVVAVHWTAKVATATLFVAICLLILSPTRGGSLVTFQGYQFFSATSWQTYGLWLFAIGMSFSVISGGIYISRAVALLREKKSGAGGPVQAESTG